MSPSPESKAEAVINAWSRKWAYWEPTWEPNTGSQWSARFVVRTEQQILDETFVWWSGRMRERGLDHLITYEQCIQDWVVVNWAEPYD